MAKYIVLLAALASVQGNAVNRVGGWGPPPPPPTTTPGWTTPPPTLPPATEAPGWSAPPPPPPPTGWSPPPPTNVTIALSGELAAAGAGAAAESHAENIHATGGWGVPADVIAVSGGDSIVAQDGSIIQVTAVDAESATSLNAVSVDQVAAADESLAVVASGLDVTVGQGGWAGATGEGASAAAADTSILVNV